MGAGKVIRVRKGFLASLESGETTAVVTSVPTTAPIRVVRCAGCFSPREVPTDYRRPCGLCGRYATTSYEEKQIRNIFVEEFDE